MVPGLRLERLIVAEEKQVGEVAASIKEADTFATDQCLVLLLRAGSIACIKVG